MYKIIPPNAMLYPVEFGPFKTEELAREELAKILPNETALYLDDLAKRVIVKLRVKNLECNCCGRNAPAYKQWHNRDIGYGMCRRCIKSIRSKKQMTEEEIKSSYGVEGIHWL